jgi:hypothetical protein
MSDAFNELIGNYFTKEEWDLWVKGEFDLFDAFVERTGMTKDDADRFRKGKPLKKPLTFPKNCRKLNQYERNNT